MPRGRKPLDVATTAFSALILVAAVISTIWAVSYHREGSRLKVCWNGGFALYKEGTAERASWADTDYAPCEKAEEIVWGKHQVPLTVAILSPDGRLSMEADDIQLTKTIINDINAQFGFEFYRLSKGRDSLVFFYPRTAYESGSSDDPRQASSVPGWTSHSKTTDGRLRVDVYIRDGLPTRYAYRVGVHVFGHAAGLEHDVDDPSSVMFPLSEDDTDSMVVLPSRFTRHDIGLFKIYRKIVDGKIQH